MPSYYPSLLERVNESVSDEKPPAGKGVDNLLSTSEFVLHFVRFNSDSVTKQMYYYY